MEALFRKVTNSIIEGVFSDSLSDALLTRIEKNSSVILLTLEKLGIHLQLSLSETALSDRQICTGLTYVARMLEAVTLENDLLQEFRSVFHPWYILVLRNLQSQHKGIQEAILQILPRLLILDYGRVEPFLRGHLSAWQQSGRLHHGILFRVMTKYVESQPDEFMQIVQRLLVVGGEHEDHGLHQGILTLVGHLMQQEEYHLNRSVYTSMVRCLIHSLLNERDKLCMILGSWVLTILIPQVANALHEHVDDLANVLKRMVLMKNALHAERPMHIAGSNTVFSKRGMTEEGKAMWQSQYSEATGSSMATELLSERQQLQLDTSSVNNYFTLFVDPDSSIDTVEAWCAGGKIVGLGLALRQGSTILDAREGGESPKNPDATFTRKLQAGTILDSEAGAKVEKTSHKLHEGEFITKVEASYNTIESSPGLDQAFIACIRFHTNLARVLLIGDPSVDCIDLQFNIQHQSIARSEIDETLLTTPSVHQVELRGLFGCFENGLQDIGIITRGDTDGHIVLSFRPTYLEKCLDGYLRRLLATLYALFPHNFASILPKWCDECPEIIPCIRSHWKNLRLHPGLLCGKEKELTRERWARVSPDTVYRLSEYLQVDNTGVVPILPTEESASQVATAVLNAASMSTTSSEDRHLIGSDAASLPSSTIDRFRSVKASSAWNDIGPSHSCLWKQKFLLLSNEYASEKYLLLESRRHVRRLNRQQRAIEALEHENRSLREELRNQQLATRQVQTALDRNREGQNVLERERVAWQATIEENLHRVTLERDTLEENICSLETQYKEDQSTIAQLRRNLQTQAAVECYLRERLQKYEAACVELPAVKAKVQELIQANIKLQSVNRTAFRDALSEQIAERDLMIERLAALLETKQRKLELQELMFRECGLSALNPNSITEKRTDVSMGTAISPAENVGPSERLRRLRPSPLLARGSSDQMAPHLPDSLSPWADSVGPLPEGPHSLSEDVLSKDYINSSVMGDQSQSGKTFSYGAPSNMSPSVATNISTADPLDNSQTGYGNSEDTKSTMQEPSKARRAAPGLGLGRHLGISVNTDTPKSSAPGSSEGSLPKSSSLRRSSSRYRTLRDHHFPEDDVTEPLEGAGIRIDQEIAKADLQALAEEQTETIYFLKEMLKESQLVCAEKEKLLQRKYVDLQHINRALERRILELAAHDDEVEDLDGTDVEADTLSGRASQERSSGGSVQHFQEQQRLSSPRFPSMSEMDELDYCASAGDSRLVDKLNHLVNGLIGSLKPKDRDYLLEDYGGSSMFPTEHDEPKTPRYNDTT